jgi:hypothetical protein
VLFIGKTMVRVRGRVRVIIRIRVIARVRVRVTLASWMEKTSLCCL